MTRWKYTLPWFLFKNNFKLDKFNSSDRMLRPPYSFQKKAKKLQTQRNIPQHVEPRAGQASEWLTGSSRPILPIIVLHPGRSKAAKGSKKGPAQYSFSKWFLTPHTCEQHLTKTLQILQCKISQCPRNFQYFPYIQIQKQHWLQIDCKNVEQSEIRFFKPFYGKICTCVPIIYSPTRVWLRWIEGSLNRKVLIIAVDMGT